MTLSDSTEERGRTFILGTGVLCFINPFAKQTQPFFCWL
jgi:hypothetical protein